jgi:CDGSH-type Zn-finger protein
MIIQCDGHGTPISWVYERNLESPPSYLLCRCGYSSNKPFCDGTHASIAFDGTEVSDNLPFEEMAKNISGPDLILKDAEILCASARFCHRGGDIWDMIFRTNDPKLRKIVIENAADCPSGRLVIFDKKSERPIEPTLDKSIGFIEDPAKGVGGPLWVRGGIPVYSVEGKMYERRNRVTLCRCGKSTNKPFCDSSHYPEEDREVIK